MYPHHATTIENTTAHFSSNPDVLALLLSGSIAHGFATPTSDVDVLIILTEEAYARQVAAQRLTFVSTDLATYPGGFVDAKYLSLNFIKDVAERGSEPARFAFDGVKVLFSRIPDQGLEEVIARAVRYPVEGKRERMVRFRVQLEAWRWFCGEGRQKGNAYLLGLAVRKLVLFGGRLILAENEVLYPFHKWFLRVLEGVEEKPEGLMECINRVIEDPSEANVEEFYEMVMGFREWEVKHPPGRWGTQFMLDNELTWMTGNTPVDDL
jgi:predicted nucleotidyltransferase